MSAIHTGTGLAVPAIRAPRRFLSLGATALLVVCLTSLTGCDKFKSKQLIREGNAFFKEQMYEEALKRYKQAKDLDPQEVRLDKFVAMGYMALYNPGSTHPKDIDALNQAVAHFKTYLAAKPDDDKAAKYLVTTYMNAQKYDDAIAYFKDLFNKHPNDAQAVQTVAMLYAKKGDFEQSMEWQRKRAKLEPNNADVFYTMGVTAWDKSYNTPGDGLDPAKRKTILDEGMENLKKANSLRKDYFEAMLYINLLDREYAKMEADPAKKQAFLDDATTWQKQALEARKRVLQKQREEQAAKNPLEAM
jgi:tetratricopeptide (TPR) repeat protein